MSGEFHNSIEDVKLNENSSEDYSNNNLSCELCNVKVTSAKILQRHLDGRRHKMKAERKGKTFACEMCDVVANSEIQLSIHMNSIKHRNKLMKKEKTELGPAASANGIGLWILLFCVVCIFINLLLLFKLICS